MEHKNPRDFSEFSPLSYFYSYAGLVVQSQLCVPEWAAFECRQSRPDPDVQISIHADGNGYLPEFFREEITEGGIYRFLVPTVGQFDVQEGRTIGVTPAPGASHGRIRPWLIGSAWAALCHQRGLFLTHASAVLVGRAAVLFCARAKRGKSTIAAELNRRGYRLISDDFCRLEIPGQGTPIVYPSAPRIKLWADAIERLGWRAEHLEPDHARAGKFHATPKLVSSAGPLPVSNIYLLEWANKIEINLLSGTMALQRFVAASIYRPTLVEQTGKLGDHMRQSIRLLQRVPIWELSRPHDPGSIERGIDALEEQWSRRIIDL
jgi:hypothetical protein